MGSKAAATLAHASFIACSTKISLNGCVCEHVVECIDCGHLNLKCSSLACPAVFHNRQMPAVRMIHQRYTLLDSTFRDILPGVSKCKDCSKAAQPQALPTAAEASTQCYITDPRTGHCCTVCMPQRLQAAPLAQHRIQLRAYRLGTLDDEARGTEAPSTQEHATSECISYLSSGPVLKAAVR